MRQLRDDVIDERYNDVEAEQHEQPLADEDGHRAKAGDKASHNRTVYTQEAIR